MNIRNQTPYAALPEVRLPAEVVQELPKLSESQKGSNRRLTRRAQFLTNSNVFREPHLRTVFRHAAFADATRHTAHLRPDHHPAEERLPGECGDEGARRGSGREGCTAERPPPFRRRTRSPADLSVRSHFCTGRVLRVALDKSCVLFHLTRFTSP